MIWKSYLLLFCFILFFLFGCNKSENVVQINENKENIVEEDLKKQEVEVNNSVISFTWTEAKSDNREFVEFEEKIDVPGVNMESSYPEYFFMIDWIGYDMTESDFQNEQMIVMKEWFDIKFMETWENQEYKLKVSFPNNPILNHTILGWYTHFYKLTLVNDKEVYFERSSEDIHSVISRHYYFNWNEMIDLTKKFKEILWDKFLNRRVFPIFSLRITNSYILFEEKPHPNYIPDFWMDSSNFRKIFILDRKTFKILHESRTLRYKR